MSVVTPDACQELVEAGAVNLQPNGRPPSAAHIVSPCDLAARYARRGQVTRWTGYLVHVTETCSGDGPNVITDVATMPATSDDKLTAIAVSIEHLSLLPPGESTSTRPPAAFQHYLDQHDIQRLRSWRAVS